MEQTLEQTEKKSNPLTLLAGLFDYPGAYYHKKVDDAFNYLKNNYPDAAKELNDFAGFVANSTVEELQDLFLRSFDVQAITTLDIGYVLWGDDYKRGQLLVHLNREHREAGNIITSELSDHLPNVLRLVPKIKNSELKEELIVKIIVPAIQKMIGEFDPKKIKMKDEIYKKHLKSLLDVSIKYRTIFSSTLKAVIIVLKNDFHLQTEEIMPEKNGNDFLQKVGEEMRIEG